MRVINSMHTCICEEDFDVIVVKNVNKWLQMKSLGKFGKYFKSIEMNTKLLVQNKITFIRKILLKNAAHV
jgi:hypothetical protein